MNAHQFDARGRQGRKLNYERFSFAIKTKASTVVGKGEVCVPCDPEYELRKGESLTKSCAENTRGWDRKKRKKKTQEGMNVFPAPFGSCVDRLGAVPADNPEKYQHQVPGGVKLVYFGQTPPSQLHYNSRSKPESSKAGLNE